MKTNSDKNLFCQSIIAQLDYLHKNSAEISKDEFDKIMFSVDNILLELDENVALLNKKEWLGIISKKEKQELIDIIINIKYISWKLEKALLAMQEQTFQHMFNYYFNTKLFAQNGNAKAEDLLAEMKPKFRRMLKARLSSKELLN